MLTRDPWFWLSVTVGVAGTGLAALLVLQVLAKPDLLRRHAFFVFFFLVATIYLQIAPVASLASADVPALLVVYRIPPPQTYVREYAIVQALCLIFFQLPLFAAYFRQDRAHEPDVLTVDKRRGQWLATGAIGLAMAFVAVVARNNLWFLRLGAEALAERFVALPFADFVLFRSYQESALFLIGLLFFAAYKSTGRTRRWLFVAFGANVGLYGAYNLLFSRWFIASLAMCLAGWWLTTRSRRLAWTPRSLTAVAGGGLLVAYLLIVVVNVRNLQWEGSFKVEALNPFLGGVFADTQGVSRLNCIDLMARLLPGIHEKGPSLGASWGQVTWLVRRFVDPEGFDRYRLAMATTAKSHLMDEYLDWRLPDYFSCTATDLFGSFHVAGLVLGALALSALFRFARRALTTPATGWQLTLGVFVVTQILIFDQEALVTFFGWPRKLPILLAMLALNPFVVSRQPRDDARTLTGP
jgi:hypothetical protein